MGEDKHPQKGQSSLTCKAMADLGLGSYSYDAFGTACWAVYGMAIQINPIINSIMEGAMITNINFHTRANPPPAPKPEDLKGQSTFMAPITDLRV